MEDLGSDGLRVALVARDPLVATFLAHQLRERGVEVLVTAASRVSDLSDVDAIVWDLGVANDGGDIALVEGVPTLALADGPQNAALALKSGVAGVLDRSRPADALVAAVQVVVAGLFVSEPDLPLLHPDARPPVQVDSPLSRREQEVLEALAEGLSNRDIGHQLYVSEHTVRFHVRSILEKLGATSRTQAVVLGARAGLLEF